MPMAIRLVLLHRAALVSRSAQALLNRIMLGVMQLEAVLRQRA